MKNIIIHILLLTAMVTSAQVNSNLIIGTYTHSCNSEGIYVYEFDSGTAETKLKAHTSDIVSPGYLAVSPDINFVYAVNEDGDKSTVSAFNFNRSNGKLHFLNKQESAGASPCFIINDDKNVIVANYSGGNISVFSKKKDGSIKTAGQVIDHHGKSLNGDRQEAPHVHMVQFSPDNQFVFANDLGTNRIYSYRYDPDADEPLVFSDSIPIKTGSGPRHLAFNSSHQVYLLQELDGTITAFNYNEGRLQKFQEISVVSDKFPGKISAAAIKISADGRFLYATNRGDANTISVFSIGNRGRLEFVETVSSMGKSPRDIAIDPSGKFLLAAHEISNEVVIFERHPVSGKLTDSGKRIKLCAPVCLVFTAAE